MDQCAEVRLDQETGEVWRWEKPLDTDAVCRQFYSTFISSTLPRKLLNGLNTSNWEEK